MFYILGLKPSSGVSGQYSPFFGQKTDYTQGHRRAAVAVSTESHLIQINADTYEPRKPRANDYFRCTEAHFEELEALWDDRYANRYGFWRSYVIEVIYRYLECGDLHCGFARVKCFDCNYYIYCHFHVSVATFVRHVTRRGWSFLGSSCVRTY